MYRKLLCYFTTSRELDSTIDNIAKNFKVGGNRIFIFYNRFNPHQLFCTFTVDELYNLIDKIIIVHRKSETNTIYTINALNEIIKNCNNGLLVKDYQIDWSLYQNQLLLYKNSQVEVIEFELQDQIFI